MARFYAGSNSKSGRASSLKELEFCMLEIMGKNPRSVLEMRNFSDRRSFPVRLARPRAWGRHSPFQAPDPTERTQRAGVRPPHAFQGGGCFWEEEKREGEISGNTKALRPFQDLSVLSLPSWCQGKHVALGRCSVHICSSREGAPRGNLGHRPSQPLSVYYSTSQGTGRNRGSRKCQ